MDKGNEKEKIKMKKILVNLGITLFPLLTSGESLADCYGNKCQMNINVIACVTKDHTVSVNRWLSDGDNQAVAKEVINGNCQLLYNGTQVFVEKHGFEWAQVRQHGSNITVWVLEKHLQ